MKAIYYTDTDNDINSIVRFIVATKNKLRYIEVSSFEIECIKNSLSCVIYEKLLMNEHRIQWSCDGYMYNILLIEK